MTKVVFDRSAHFYSFRMTGHTDQTVCAGISAIIQLLAGWLQNNRALVEDSYIHLEAGHSVIAFKSADIRADAVYEACLIGMLQIEKGYPEAIHIEYD